MAICLVASLALAFVSLLAARYLTSDHWVDALFVTGGSLGLAGAMVLGLVSRRVTLVRGAWLWPAALILALGAALGRSSLLSQLAHNPSALVTLDFWRIALACSTVVWGVLALVWGALAVSDGVERSPRGARKRRSLRAVAGGAAAVSLALYSVSPLRDFFGITINAVTLAGLFSLAAMAYGAGVLARWVFRGKQDRP